MKDDGKGKGKESQPERREFAPLGGRSDPRKGQDARAEIRVSEDGMEALADFYPPRGKGEPLSRQYLYNQMSAFDIVKGYDEEAISRALEECNLEKKTVRDARIALGKKPVDSVKAHIALDPRFLASAPKIDEKAIRIDFKELSPFIMVHKGERLGGYLEDRAGEEGYDVKGSILPCGKKQETEYTLGDKVRQEGAAVLADADGRFVLSGKRVSVEEVLEVKEKVDYHTGNLVFPGNIVIGQGVEPGFKVYSGASILCKNTMDATDVNAKKDLIVQGGLVGRHEARVRVGGRLEARFIENCRVAVREDATVEKAMLNSHLFTLGRLDMGDKGRIAGGEVWALKGLRAGTLGSLSGSPLEVHCGVDFTIKQKVDFIKERLRVLVAKALKAEELAKTKPGPALQAISREIQAMQAQLLASLSELEPKVDAEPQAVVEVRGEVYPGVTIAICGCSMTVTEKLGAMRFTANLSSGRIVGESLK